MSSLGRDRTVLGLAPFPLCLIDEINAGHLTSRWEGADFEDPHVVERQGPSLTRK